MIYDTNCINQILMDDRTELSSSFMNHNTKGKDRDRAEASGNMRSRCEALTGFRCHCVFLLHKDQQPECVSV